MVEDTPTDITVLTNDSDPDGDDLTVTGGSSADGSVSVNSDGTINFTPDSNFTGSTTITYTISDGTSGTASATVSVSVSPVNDEPVAEDDTATIVEDTPTDLTVLTNDSDVDGDDLTVSTASSPDGSVVINSDGTINFTPDSNFTGTTTVTYTVTDGQGGTDSATVTVTVTNENDAPVAENDSVTISEDSVLTIDPRENDSDVDGDDLTITSVTVPDGTVVINSDGTISLTPTSNFTGTTTVTYTITDGNGGTDSATMTVDFRPINDAPVAEDDTATIVEDTPTDLTVLTNDSDVDVGDVLTVTTASTPDGSVAINSDGTLEFTPVSNFTGSTTITYTISDGNGGTDSATVTLSVTPVNDAPVAVNDTVTITEDIPTDITVLTNDSDVDVGDVLTVTTASTPDGSVVINSDGTINFTPDSNFDGTTTITYTISDGNLGTSAATVTVSVDAVNDPPVAVDDTAVVVEDTPTDLTVLPNDSDVEGDDLTVTDASSPDGSVVVNSDGTISFTPESDFTGTTVVTYVVSDGAGGTDGATVSIDVSPVNDAPVAEDESVTISEDSILVTDVLGNDSDPDGDDLTVTSASSTHGSVSINSDGTINFTPTSDLTGTATVDYVVSDGNGGTDTATLTVNLLPVNDAPVAEDDNLIVAEDAVSTTLDVLINDSDVDGDDLTITTASVNEGSVSINSDGTLSYTPVSDFTGTVTVTYTITDGEGGTDSATASVTVSPIGEPPVAADDSATIAEDTVDATITVLENDSDADGDDLTVIATSSPDGSVGINSDGTLSFTPTSDFTGTTTITYTVSDGSAGTDTATVTVSVTPVNDAPVAEDDTATVIEDAVSTVTVLPNDSDVDGDDLTVQSASAADGSVSINSDGTLEFTPTSNFTGTTTITYTITDGEGGTDSATVTLTVTENNTPPVAENDSAAVVEDGTATLTVLDNDSDIDGNPLTVTGASADAGSVTVNSDGTLSFEPDSNFTGTATITYTITDGDGGTDSATASVTVVPLNDAPVAEDDAQVIAEDTPTDLTVLPNDSDVEGDDLTVTSASTPDGSVAINSDGTINFTPISDFTGTTTVTYTISDGEGGTDSATVSLTVTPVTTPPVAEDDTVTVDEDTPTDLTVLTNDSDPDGDDLTVVGASTPDGSVVINSDGTINFTPTSDFTGTTTVTYTVSDGTTSTDTATVTVTVAPVNDDPVAEDDTQTVTEDTPTDITVLPNDSDVDGDDITVDTASSPDGSVVVNSDGTINFTPASDFTGTTSITYTVTDGEGGTDSATVTLTVTPANDPPVAENDTVTISEDSTLTIDPRENDSDVDGDDLTITTVTAPDGTVVINSDGTITFTPDSDFTGTTVVTYTITDGEGGTDSATMTIDFVPVNDAPVAGDDTPTSTIEEDVPTDITVLPNDSDVDGDDLTVTTASTPDGSVTINSDGTIEFTPTSNFTGTTTITYTVTDGEGGTDSATVDVTVTPVNDAPVGVMDTSTINVPGGTTTVDVLPNDSDVDGDDLTVTDASSADGSVVVNSDGTLTFDPDSGFTGTATVTYTVSDGAGGTDTSTLEVTVICFARGTMITMADGSTQAVEDIAAGAMVETMDHGAQELRWIGSRTVAAKGHLAPVMIKAGAMGNDADLRVSPQHRMLVEGWKAELLFGEDQVLASAKHLVNGDNIYVDEGDAVEYFHMLFDTHEIVYANGAPSESFHPGELGMGSMAEESREEILELFPELRGDNTAYGPSARTSLKAGEAKVLAKNPDFLK